MPVENLGNIPYREQRISRETLETNPTSIVVLGIDVGTSGIRGCIVEKKRPTELNKEQDLLLYSASVTLDSPAINKSDKSSTQKPQLWVTRIEQLLLKIAKGFDLSRITDLVLDATSSTVLLCNQKGEPLTEALMYNDQQAIKEAKLISQTPDFNPNSGAAGASSCLAKALLLLKRLKQNEVVTTPATANSFLQNPIAQSEQSIYVCHQIDYLNHFLSGCHNTTDENNALKIGYDSINQAWPDWVKKILSLQNGNLKLPKVVRPGARLGLLRPEIIARYGFSESTCLHAGTTDSIAGFLASGANRIGDVVISLGSTLAIKVISDEPIFSSDFGVYSHRLKNSWLVGGASNSGGAVLTEQFSMAEMTALIRAIQDSNLTLSKAEQVAYYPLNNIGERFPIADSNLQPTMPIKPIQKINLEAPSIAHQRYFLGLIHGLIHIELLAYEKLQALGCRHLRRIYAVGGGVQNKIWMALRAERLQNSRFTLSDPKSLDAAFGVTRLVEYESNIKPES